MLLTLVVLIAGLTFLLLTVLADLIDGELFYSTIDQLWQHEEEDIIPPCYVPSASFLFKELPFSCVTDIPSVYGGIEKRGLTALPFFKEKNLPIFHDENKWRKKSLSKLPFYLEDELPVCLKHEDNVGSEKEMIKDSVTHKKRSRFSRFRNSLKRLNCFKTETY